MLKAVLPLSLMVAHAEREACQHQAVDLIGSAFAQAEARLVVKAADAEARVGEAQNEKAAALAIKDEREADLTAKASVTAKKKQELAEKNEALARAESAVREAEAAQRSGDADLEAAAAQKERIESVYRDTFVPMKDGSSDNPGAPEKVEALLSLGRELGLDDSLCASLASVLKKGADTRGAFDGMVLEQFEVEISSRGASLGTALAEGEPAKAERARAVEEAKEVSSAAHAECTSSRDALKDAEAAEAQSRSSTAVAEKDEALAVAGEISGMEKTKLATFRASPLAAFRELEAPAAQSPMEAEGEGAAPAPPPAEQ